MTVVTVVGEPTSVCSLLDAIIGAGNNITILKMTKNNSTYIVGYEPSGPMVNDFLLMEDGSFLLLESGDKIILE